MEYFIISKGRASEVITSRLLDAVGILHTIVVEPQDEYNYAQHLTKSAKLLVLPKDDQGISYVRKFVLDNARGCGTRRFCMMDDDVKAFGTVSNGRCVKGDARLLELAERCFVQNNFAQMGLQYQQFAWCASKDFNSPTHCDCVVFFDTSQLDGIEYDSYVDMKEDWDFSLQVLRAGKCTAVLNRIWMSVPTMGTNKGGLADAYANHRDWQSAERLQRKWGTDIVSVRWKNRDGSKVLDCKVDWKYFQKMHRRSK